METLDNFIISHLESIIIISFIIIAMVVISRLLRKKQQDVSQVKDEITGSFLYKNRFSDPNLPEEYYTNPTFDMIPGNAYNEPDSENK